MSASDVAVGLFLGHFWSANGTIENRRFLYTGLNKYADQAAGAARTLGAGVARTTLGHYRTIFATWEGTGANRNHWPYGKTRFQVATFLLRGDLEQRCSAFLAAVHENDWHADELLLVIALECTGIGFNLSPTAVTPLREDLFKERIEPYLV